MSDAVQTQLIISVASLAGTIVLALIGAFAAHQLVRLRGEQALLRQEQANRFTEQGRRLEQVAIQAEKGTKIAEKSLAIGNSTLRVPLQLAAETLRWKADSEPENVQFRAAAEAAEKSLADHDREQVAGGYRSGVPSGAAQKIADREAEQARDVEAYSKAQEPRGGSHP